MSILHPRARYMEETRLYSLSETISEAQSLLGGGLELVFKSPESHQISQTNHHDHAIGREFQFRNVQKDYLFVYIGLVYDEMCDEIIYPSMLFLGTDLEGQKLRVFLHSIQRDLEYLNRRNVLDDHFKVNGDPTGSPFLTCIEVHKRRKKGIYLDLEKFRVGGSLNQFKEVLDS